jgi:hypothetical protein
MGTPVSGPGGFSQRTDKAVGNANASLPNAQYGENKDYQEIKSGAPVGASPGGMDIGSLMGSMAPEAIGLGESSQQPDVPVTDGAALGAGAGTEVLNLADNTQANAQATAWLPALEWIANQPGTSDANRNLIRQMKASMG